MTCWRFGAQWFSNPKIPEKKKIFTKWGYPQDSKPSGLKQAGSMLSHGLHQGKAHMHGGIDKQISRVLQRDLTKGSMMIYGSTMGISRF